MKKLAIISAIALSGLAFTSASAQVRVNVGFNLGGPVVVQRPVPVAAYDDYYYLPEVDSYYSVGENLYYYNDGYDWVSAAYLPGAYRGYNWRNVRSVEIHGNRPYMNHAFYRTRYSGNRFDWRGYNGMAGRGFDRNDRGNWNNNRDNRTDWNGRDRRPAERNDNRGGNNGWGGNQGPVQQPGRGGNNGWGGGNQGPSQPGRGDNRPSQNDNRGGDRGGRPNFANNNGNGFGRGNRF